MAKIKKAYCLEMNRIVTSSQARVAFLSKDNTYKVFHFYCTGCGEKLESVHVMHRGELTPKMRTTHFKIWKLRKHTQLICLELNSSSTSPHGGKSNPPSDTKNIIYKVFKLIQIDYEIEKEIDDSNIPEQCSLEVIDSALESNIDVDIYETYVFQDIINCYNELIENDEVDQFELYINDIDNRNTYTYKTIFKDINYLVNDRYERIHEKSNKFFENKIIFGEIFNKRFKDTGEDWNFVIKLDKKYLIEEINDDKKEYFWTSIRISIPNNVLNENINLKKGYLEQLDSDKVLDKCYIINSIPTLRKIHKENKKDTYELLFSVNDLNHLHITFKEDSLDDSSE